MDEKLLCQLGLNTNLAHIYRLLVERKSLRPSQLAKITHESRTNCYALLDKLVGMGLAKKLDVEKKIIYYPENPTALERLMSKHVAEAQDRLATVQRALPQMLSAFNDRQHKTHIVQHHGKEELYGMYVEQMEQMDNNLYFLRSTSDVPYFGYETMSEIRHFAKMYKKQRHGITPFVYYAPSDPMQDAQGNLTRTWLPKASYTAPVEWVAVGDEVHIINFAGEGSGIVIKDTYVADGLRQLLKLFAKYIHKDPTYAHPKEVSARLAQNAKEELIQQAKISKEKATEAAKRRQRK